MIKQLYIAAIFEYHLPKIIKQTMSNGPDYTTKVLHQKLPYYSTK